MKKIHYITILIFFYTNCHGQILNGTWRGFGEHSLFILNPIETIMEVEIYNDSVITGVIHNYYKKQRFDHIKISGTIKWKDSIVNIIEVKEISHNINTKIYETCLGTMELKFSQVNNKYTLKGKWVDQSKKLIHCPTLRTWFEKQISDSSKLIQEHRSTRKTDIQNVIELSPDETDSIKLTLYDNAEIDNDTASVFFDDSLLLKSKRLSQTPIDIIISFDKKIKMHHIKLVAENLGTIPPNTALLIITTRKNRYTITLSSDYSQNGAVEFFLKE